MLKTKAGKVPAFINSQYVCFVVFLAALYKSRSINGMDRYTLEFKTYIIHTSG